MEFEGPLSQDNPVWRIELTSPEADSQEAKGEDRVTLQRDRSLFNAKDYPPTLCGGCDLLAAEHLHAENDSPLGRAEVLHKSVPDAQLYPQISSRTGALETPG